MFCPKCGAEYRQGFTKCADCGVDLVWEKPEIEDRIEYVEYTEVLRTFNAGDIAILRSVLDGDGITYYIKGEFFGNIRPLAEPASLMVRKDQVERALELIKPLKLRYRGISGGSG